MILSKKAVAFILVAIFFSLPPQTEAKEPKRVSDLRAAEISVVSGAVVMALSRGDLSGAILSLREEKMTPKILYLVREVTRLNNFEAQKKPDKSKAHKIYQNAAIDYHNLYLFLKEYGIEQEDFLKNAHRYYRKAGGYGSSLHKADCKLLGAALYASSGDLKKARKQFDKIDLDMMRGDFESMEYLAAYYAAMGDVTSALEALKDAYRLNPDAWLTWLAVGDDFNAIKDNPEFEKLLLSLKVKEAEKKLTLSLPKASKPRLEVSDESGLFRPQKSMPHYVLKKKGKTPKKKPAASARKKVK